MTSASKALRLQLINIEITQTNVATSVEPVARECAPPFEQFIKLHVEDFEILRRASRIVDEHVRRLANPICSVSGLILLRRVPRPREVDHVVRRLHVCPIEIGGTGLGTSPQNLRCQSQPNCTKSEK